MDPRLKQTVESGRIDELYALIDENPYILENIDAVPFVNTPLHVAAASGNLPFAMEIMNLKPSFARKLNTNGYSPLHLAVEENESKFVCWMLCLDPSLVRIKGKNGITPFLSLVIRGEADLVVECLLTSPKCIEDANVNNMNALHLAVMNDNFEVLQVLTGWIQRMSQKHAYSIENEFLNKLDFSNNTALHLAAYKNDLQAVKLLLECRMVERNEVNNVGLTFLDILRNQGQRAESDDLRNQGQGAVGGDLELEQIIKKTGCEEAVLVPKVMTRSEFYKSPITLWTYCRTGMRRLKLNNSDEARGAFLIVCTLIITATYQTVLQPPGGIHQSNDKNAGSVVMKQAFFIFLWISNTLGFCCAVFYTFCLIPYSNLFTTWFFWIGTSLCISYALAMAVISPRPLVFLLVTFAFILLCAGVSFFSLFVVGWWEHKKWFWKD